MPAGAVERRRALTARCVRLWYLNLNAETGQRCVWLSLTYETLLRSLLTRRSPLVVV
jgi:hypothetical protein